MHVLFSKYTVNSNGTARGDDEPVDEEDAMFFEEQRGSQRNESEGYTWTNGVLLLVSNRLGLQKLQSQYFSAIKAFFLSKQNCGIIGGRPKEAYYLVGVQEDNLILLDPHNAQQTIELEERELKQKHGQFHELQAKKISINRLDPTMTFAVYLRSEVDFAMFKDWQEQMKHLFEENWLFSCMESKPDFMRNSRCSNNRGEDSFEDLDLNAG